MEAAGEIWRRLQPDPTVVLDPTRVGVLLVVTVLVVLTAPTWRLVRIGVTVVHELGHAAVGVLVGRRFTGFVVRGDMSGHAVTVGPARGPGRVLTTCAGYPAPAWLGAGLIGLTTRGWAGPALAVAGMLLLVALPRVRSLLTAVVVAGGTALAGWLWWSGPGQLQAQVVLIVGVVLLIGAWRHLSAVLTAGGTRSDPAVLATLTRLPRWLWLGSFVLALAGASWCAALTLADTVS